MSQGALSNRQCPKIQRKLPCVDNGVVWEPPACLLLRAAKWVAQGYAVAAAANSDLFSLFLVLVVALSIVSCKHELFGGNGRSDYQLAMPCLSEFDRSRTPELPVFEAVSTMCLSIASGSFPKRIGTATLRKMKRASGMCCSPAGLTVVALTDR